MTLAIFDLKEDELIASIDGLLEEMDTAEEPPAAFKLYTHGPHRQDAKNELRALLLEELGAPAYELERLPDSWSREAVRVVDTVDYCTRRFADDTKRRHLSRERWSLRIEMTTGKVYPFGVDGVLYTAVQEAVANPADNPLLQITTHTGTTTLRSRDIIAVIAEQGGG